MNRRKTLYVSDLDGTLLRGDETLSPFTIQTVNQLTEQGMLFSYATARSHVTAGKITEKMTPQIPVIVYNGAFILPNGGGKPLRACYFQPKEAQYILELLNGRGIFPIVYATIEGKEKFSYWPEQLNDGMKAFLKSRKGDIRENPTDRAGLGQGKLFYFTCVDQPERLGPVYALLKGRFQCVYHRELYTGEQWLEVMPRQATKAQAVLELKERLGCQKVVCFGDGINDLPMFAAAEESYAVANACQALKDAASAVIDSAEQDGVAKKLLELWNKEREKIV